MEKFKRYYLIWFILFGALSVYGLIINRESLNEAPLLLLLFSAVVAPIMMGKLTDWAQNVWSPKRRIKFYNQEPLVSLTKLGFHNFENVCFKGEFRNFHISIYYDHSFTRSLTYNVLYSPQHYDIRELERINSLFDKNPIDVSLVFPGLIALEREIKLKIPGIDKIKLDLDHLIDNLESKSILPINPDDLEKIVEKQRK